MRQQLLDIVDIRPGIQKITLDVGALYSDGEQVKRFEERFESFLSSHELHRKLFEWTRDKLEYRTECIIPSEEDIRPPLLLVFGNPAPQSVFAEMFFASERRGQEHRFWRILRETGLLVFPADTSKGAPEECNRLRKESLYQLSYDSPFRVGLAVFCTMPSSASGSWSGVAGLRRLFGGIAFERICACESERINRLIRGFVSAKGAVITFQKDAYLWVKSSMSPDYGLADAKAGRLIGTCGCDPIIRLFGFPPTRLMYGRKSRDLLQGLIAKILDR